MQRRVVEREFHVDVEFVRNLSAKTDVIVATARSSQNLAFPNTCQLLFWENHSLDDGAPISHSELCHVLGAMEPRLLSGEGLFEHKV